MALDILYFAWVRERIGTGQERLEPPPEVRSVVELVGWLAQLSEAHAHALGEPERLRHAVDGGFVSPDAPIAGAREVAIFPPVTGG